MNPIYRIYRSNNYVYIYDVDNNKLYQEHSFRVLVKKDTLNGDLYNISFLRPETTPGVFYTVTWQQLRDVTNTPFASAAAWETWYQDNTGDIGLGSGFATEATLQQVEVNTSGVSRTPQLSRISGSAGNVPLGKFSMSFASVGTANATVGGIILKPGETINFDAGALNNTLTAVAYDTTTAGAELIIIAIA
jgi:hypothetical protein